MVLIEIDKINDTCNIFDKGGDNEWNYMGKYQSHHVDSNGILNINFDTMHIEMPMGGCILVMNCN